MGNTKKNSILSVIIWFLVGIIGYTVLVAVQQFVIGLDSTSLISKIVVVGQYACIILSMCVLAFHYGKLLPSLLAIVVMLMQPIIALIFMIPNWWGQAGIIDLLYYIGDTALQNFPYLTILLIFGLICRFIPKFSSLLMKVILFGVSGILASLVSLKISMVMFQIQQVEIDMLLFNIFPFFIAFAVYALYLFTVGDSNEIVEVEDELVESDGSEIDELLKIDGLDQDADLEVLNQVQEEVHEETDTSEK